MTISDNAIRELSLLDDLHRVVWPKAMNGNLEAVACVLKIMERRSALLGLDRPRKFCRVDPAEVEDASDDHIHAALLEKTEH